MSFKKRDYYTVAQQARGALVCRFDGVAAQTPRRQGNEE
jgi:hypothetical protein